MDESVSWADLKLTEPHLRAVQAVAAEPSELAGVSVPTLRSKGLTSNDIRALLRGIARVVARRELASVGELAPELDRPLLPEVAPGLRWVDLHLNPAVFADATRLVESPAELVGLSMEELLRMGFSPRQLQEIFRALRAYSRGHTEIPVLPGRTVYVEELRAWVRSHGPLPEALGAKRLPEAPASHLSVRRLSNAASVFAKQVQLEASIGASRPLTVLSLGELIDRGANPGILLDLAERSEAAGHAKWAMPRANEDAALAAAQEILGCRESAQIRATDLRFGALVRHIAQEAQTALEAAQIVLELSELHRGRFPARALLITRLAAEISAARDLTLEAELTAIAQAISPLRPLERVFEHFGWSGGPPLSIAEVADRAGVSKQRVSYLCKPFSTVKGAGVFAPALERALAVLDRSRGRTVDEAGCELVAEGITDGRVHPLGVLEAAKLLGRDPALAACWAGGAEYVAPKGSKVPVLAVRRARKLAASRGAARIDDVVPEGSDETLRALITAELAGTAGFVWLDEQSRWFTFPEHGRWGNRVLHCVEKMLSVTPSLALDDIQAGLRRYSRRRPTLRAEILERLCACLPGVRVGPGGRVHTETPPAREKVLSAAELDCVRHLESRTDSDAISRVTQAWRKTRFSRSMLFHVLARSPVLVRHGHDRYRLIGRNG